jgi:hypothetical protein
MNTNFFSIVLGSVLLLSLGYSPTLLADGPYHGRVIDKETKQPIEGAVALSVWYRRTASLGHPSIAYYDAQETLTDKDGNFTIPGTSTFSLNPLSRIDEPRFTIFKPGYEVFGTYEGRGLDTPEKNGHTVVELQPLKTREEKLENQAKVSVLDCDSRDKCPNLIRLINVERSNLGLKAIGPVKKAK